jgi:hypothetical protein
MQFFYNSGVVTQDRSKGSRSFCDKIARWTRKFAKNVQEK